MCVCVRVEMEKNYTQYDLAVQNDDAVSGKCSTRSDYSDKKNL
jgi:hypothetical protein